MKSNPNKTIFDITANELENRVESVLEDFSKEDKIAWRQLPMTQALLLQLKAWFVANFEEWANGSLTSESVEGTAQLNAKAMGHINACERVIEWIREVDTNYEKVETYEEED